MNVLEACNLIDVSPVHDETCLTDEDVSSKKKKLILIQAPSNFDMNRLKNEKILLDGLQDLAADENTDKGRRFAVKSTMNCKKNMKSFSIILPSKEDSKLKLARPLRGSISIIQSIRVPPVTFPEKEDVVLPVVTQKQKHRWTPFGCDYPLRTQKQQHKRNSRHSKVPSLDPKPKTKKIISVKKEKFIEEATEAKKLAHLTKKRVKKEAFEEDETVSDNLSVSPRKIKKEIDDFELESSFVESTSPKKKSKKKKHK